MRVNVTLISCSSGSKPNNGDFDALTWQSRSDTGLDAAAHLKVTSPAQRK
jgi:hypothetical protein